jgi:acyl-CoA thioesterase-1
VYGDSLSAGYGLPSGRDWASLLAGRLREVGLNYKVANASISGETTVGGKNRIAASLKQHQPDVVILALGANDGLRGGSLDEMRANLENHRGRDPQLRGARAPRGHAPAAQLWRRLYGKVPERIRRSCGEPQVPLVPFMFEGFSEKRAYFLPDTVHPAADAQPIILETVWKGLRPLLKKS